MRLFWRARQGRWGWRSDPWTIEWRRPEPGCPRGYWLFGPGVDGSYLGTDQKSDTLAGAERIIRDLPGWEL